MKTGMKSRHRTRSNSLMGAAALMIAAPLSIALLAGQPAFAHTPLQTALAAGNVLSVEQLQQRATVLGIKVKETEIKGLLVEIEGHDAHHREVEMTLDRRTGEILDIHPDTADIQASSLNSTAGTLSLAQLKQRAAALGIEAEKVKFEGLLAEIDGHDAQHREVDLTLDRRNGEVLYRHRDD